MGTDTQRTAECPDRAQGAVEAEQDPIRTSLLQSKTTYREKWGGFSRKKSSVIMASASLHTQSHPLGATVVSATGVVMWFFKRPHAPPILSLA